MSTNVADILRGAGFVPITATVPPLAGDVQTQAGSRVPIFPTIPARNCKGGNETHNTGAIRARLLALAAAVSMDSALVRVISESFLRDCDGMANDALRALLSMVADDADRERGIVPPDDIAAILCRSCGPVWVHPAIARVLPVVDGWPRALGCPWCFIRARGIAIPRPHATYSDHPHEESDHRIGACHE